MQTLKKIEDKEYGYKEYSVLDQLYISRKIAPFYIELSSGMPFADAVAKIPQEDFEYITTKVLKNIAVNDSGKWNDITKDGVLIYDYVHAGVVLELVMSACIIIATPFFKAIDTLMQ